MLLAGDVGGTKTHLAILSTRDEIRMPIAEAKLPSADYPDLESLVQTFLARTNLAVERACFGVAGPVIAGKATITNLPWEIDERHLEEQLHIPVVTLLNDLNAMAHAVPFLEASDLFTLNAGQRVPHGPVALIAPGTGLGEAFLVWNGTHYQAQPSEGGHTEFGPLNPLEIDLLRFLLNRFEHVSYEHVCSGVGIPNIYAFLRNRNAELAEPVWLTQQMAQVRDITPLIINAALDSARPCQLCTMTVKTFVSILGAEAGNLALKVLATGGVYIGGGIPPRILPFFQDGLFMQSFQHKGRLSEVLTTMPVHLILNDGLALLGAAIHGFEQMELA
jgi:glucokinase